LLLSIRIMLWLFCRSRLGTCLARRSLAGTSAFPTRSRCLVIAVVFSIFIFFVFILRILISFSLVISINLFSIRAAFALCRCANLIR
jgi:hypothetical protein